MHRQREHFKAYGGLMLSAISAMSTLASMIPDLGWTWEPVVMTILAASALLYIVGLVRLWTNAGRSKGIRAWQVLAFAGGWIALVVALVSPLDALGDILFAAHMAQHEVLMVIAVPLLVLGRPLIALLWAMPSRWRSPIAQAAQSRPVAVPWNFFTAPAVAVVVHALALWIWHLPSLYQATLRSEWIHGLQHTSFILTAALFWWSLIHGRYGRLGYGAAVVYVFFTSTFSPNLWYPIYQAPTVLGLALFTAWLGEAERRVRLAEMKR